MPSGKDLATIAAAAKKLEAGFEALAEAIGIPVDSIEHTALPVRKKGELAPPPADPEPQGDKQGDEPDASAQDGKKK